MSLEALERSDLSRLPGGIFTRAFIRAYAQEVGLDPDRTIQEFIAELPPEAVTVTAHAAAIEDGEKLEADRKAVATAMRLAAISIPIVGLVMYYGACGTPGAVPSADAVSVVQTSASDSAAVEPPPVAGSTAQPDAALAVPAAAPLPTGLSMELMPKAACWVSVNTDGERVFSGLMNAGDRRVVTAKEQIVLNVGDAGAFAYTLNGRPGKPLGAPGEVVSTRITLANLRDFSTP